MSSDNYRDRGDETSIWRDRVLGKKRCPNCDFELNEPSQKADPDKLFLFGFLFILIGAAAFLETKEGYASHIFLIQIFLGVGVIAWGVFRYRELRRRHRRPRRHRTTPRLEDVLAKQGGGSSGVTPSQGNSTQVVPDAPPSTNAVSPPAQE